MMCLCRNFGMLRLTYHFRACKIVEHFPQTCRCISKALSSNAWLALCQHITWRSELLTQKKRYRSVRLQSNWGRHDPAGCWASRIRVSDCFRGDRLTFWGVYAGLKLLRSLQQARIVAVISWVMRQRSHMPHDCKRTVPVFIKFGFLSCTELLESVKLSQPQCRLRAIECCSSRKAVLFADCAAFESVCLLLAAIAAYLATAI